MQDVKLVGFIYTNNANNRIYLIELFRELNMQTHVKSCNSSATQNFGYIITTAYEITKLSSGFLTMSVIKRYLPTPPQSDLAVLFGPIINIKAKASLPFLFPFI